MSRTLGRRRRPLREFYQMNEVDMTNNGEKIFVINVFKEIFSRENEEEFVIVKIWLFQSI